MAPLSNTRASQQTLTQCWCNAGPPSATLAPTLNQHYSNLGHHLVFPWCVILCMYSTLAHCCTSTDDCDPAISHRSADNNESTRKHDILIMDQCCSTLHDADPTLILRWVNGCSTEHMETSKHEAFTQCCINVGPPSSTLAQH